MGNQLPLRMGHSSLPLSAHVYWGQTIAHLSYCSDFVRYNFSYQRIDLWHFCTRDKAALPWQPILGLKLLQMHFCDKNDNVITYNIWFSWSANLKKTFCDCNGLSDVATVTNFAKIGKNLTQMAQHQLCDATYQCDASFWNRVLAVQELIYDTPVHKEQKALPPQPILGLKLIFF